MNLIQTFVVCATHCICNVVTECYSIISFIIIDNSSCLSCILVAEGGFDVVRGGI